MILQTPANLYAFLEANNLNAYINLAQADRERQIVVGKLFEHLSSEESKNLIAATLAYKSGAMSFTDYYAQFSGLMSQHNVSMAHYPSLQQYIRYLLIIDGSRTNHILS